MDAEGRGATARHRVEGNERKAWYVRNHISREARRAKEKDMPTKEPFTIHITDEVLTDLRERLRRTRWADDFANEGWAYGTNGAYLKELVTYWLEQYDWRKHETAFFGLLCLAQFSCCVSTVPPYTVSGALWYSRILASRNLLDICTVD